MPRVQAFKADGTFRKAWGSYGMAPGQIIVACHLSPWSNGDVYVTDDALNRVTKFDNEGNFITMWGRLGNGPGEFYHLQGIAIDSKNRVWVLDYGNHRGQVFDLNGNFLFFFGEGIIASDRVALPTPR
jgi:DNA-binding beta-propeller fold protein YncE